MASEENFKNNASNYKYIHLATHSFIYEDKPPLSGIAFIQPKDSALKKADDGILYSGETYNLDLNADLVVLSSCESGIGKLVRGEGLMALTRGFLYSGAKNIMFSLWTVNDQPTAQLMVNFYKQMLTRKSYAQALRAAKLEMLKKSESAKPLFWSGFVLVGSSHFQIVKKDSHYGKILIIILAIISVSMLLYGLLRLKRIRMNRSQC